MEPSPAYPHEALVRASPFALRRVQPWLRSFLQLALAGGLLAALLLRVDRGAVREQLAQADLVWLPLAFAANIVSDWFRAIRWQHLLLPLRRFGVPFLFATAVLGVAGNLVLPLRAGEAVRVQVLRRRSGLGVSPIAATLVAEKLLDVVAYCTFIVLGLVLFKEASFLWPLGLAYGALVVAGLGGGRYLAKRFEGRAEPQADPPDRDRGIRARLARELHSFAGGLQAFRRPSALFHVTWTSHAAWLCEALMYYAFGRALGLDLSPAVYLLVVVAASLAVSVPVTQAGLGVFELAIAGLLIAFGVDEALAAAYAVFAHLFFALPYIVSGPLAALVLRLSFSDIFFLRASREASGEESAAEPAAGS